MPIKVTHVECKFYNIHTVYSTYWQVTEGKLQSTSGRGREKNHIYVYITLCEHNDFWNIPWTYRDIASNILSSLHILSIFIYIFGMFKKKLTHSTATKRKKIGSKYNLWSKQTATTWYTTFMSFTHPILPWHYDLAHTHYATMC